MADSYKKRRMLSDIIPQDILMEILKRLPAKSLLRSMCVQKSWYHLIKSPYFIDHHFHHKENKNKYLLFQDRYHNKFFLRVDDEQCKEYCPGLRLPCSTKYRKTMNKIHGICRGLICFSVEKLFASSQPQCVYLWNPAIRITKKLPNSPDPPSRYKSYRNYFAFGYFPKMNDYKVIKFRCYYATVREDPRAPNVYVYSLRTNSWKTVGEDKVAQSSNYEELYNSVIVNGVAYWVGVKKDPFMQVIVCFDIENEKIREIELRPQYALDVCMGHISSFNLVQHFDEVLLSAVYMNYGAGTPCVLDIFSLGKGDGEDVVCTKKVTTDLNKVGSNWWPIGFRHNGEIVLFNYHYTERGFLSYDHDKEVATEILDDSWKLWSYADIDTPDNARYEYNCGEFGPFHPAAEHMQFMYVNSFEESLVLLGEEL